MQQLTIDGNFLTRFRKASPIGDMQIIMCNCSRTIYGHGQYMKKLLIIHIQVGVTYCYKEIE